MKVNTPNARQLEALRRNAPSADDILDNPAYMEELGQEISNSYDQVAAAEEAEADPALKGLREPSALSAPVVAANVPVEEPVMSDYDPEKELEAYMSRVEAAVAPAPVEEEVAEEVDPDEVRRQQIMTLLDGCADAPSANQIAAWKRTHGETGVNAIAFGEGEAYVFTYLRRGVWQKIQSAIQQAVEKNALTNNDPDNELKEKVLQFCVLYPRPLNLEFFYQSRAGTIDTLFEIIMLHSYFLNTQQAMMLTTQL